MMVYRDECWGSSSCKYTGRPDKQEVSFEWGWGPNTLIGVRWLSEEDTRQGVEKLRFVSVCVCVRACVRACVRVCVCVCVSFFFSSWQSWQGCLCIAYRNTRFGYCSHAWCLTSPMYLCQHVNIVCLINPSYLCVTTTLVHNRHKYDYILYDDWLTFLIPRYRHINTRI